MSVVSPQGITESQAVGNHREALPSDIEQSTSSHKPSSQQFAGRRQQTSIRASLGLES